MSTLINIFKKHLSLSITIINLLLLIIVFFQKDPFSIFIKTYESSEKFLNISQSDITKIIYGRKNDTSSSKELYLEKLDWKVKSNDGIIIDADVEKVNQLIKALLEARKFTTAAEGKEKFADFGLDNSDALEIQIYSGETVKGKMTLGNAGGGGSFTHVLWNDSEAIYIVEDSLKPLLGRGADDYFFNKRISPLNLSSGDLLTVSLKSKDLKKGFELEKKDNKWVKNPSNEEVPNELINPLLNKISSLMADNIIFEKDLPKLDSSNYKLIYSFKEQGGNNSKSITLDILGKDSSDSFYLKKDSNNFIYKIQEYQIKKIIEF